MIDFVYTQIEGTQMQHKTAVSPKHLPLLDTQELREEFLIESLFIENKISLTLAEYDRMLVGGIFPTTSILNFSADDFAGLAADHLLLNREFGLINIGGPGKVVVDGQSYDIGARDGLYAGLGAKIGDFESIDAANPAKFYMCSAPAHRVCPTKIIRESESFPERLGTKEGCNDRTIYKYLHPQVVETCQLTMGLTALEPGSIWNTMAPHQHDRRMEAYFYFDISAENAVFHFMGKPDQTRHIVVRNEQAVISPPWSIHTGVGTGAYSFIWSMAGENKDFTDMDHLKISELY